MYEQDWSFDMIPDKAGGQHDSFMAGLKGGLAGACENYGRTWGVP